MICEDLGILPGITCLIGGGGKTTLMMVLAQEAPGSVIVTTTTKIYEPDGMRVLIDPREEEIRAALKTQKAVCVASRFSEEKLTACAIPAARLSRLADYVIIEADGAKGLPLKAHAEYEPVIPEGTGRTVLVVGADGFGEVIGRVCHRSEKYAALAEAGADERVTPCLAARVITKEGLGDVVFVNKAETEEKCRAARELAAELTCPVVYGSLWKGEYTICGC